MTYRNQTLDVGETMEMPVATAARYPEASGRVIVEGEQEQPSALLAKLIQSVDPAAGSAK